MVIDELLRDKAAPVSTRLRLLVRRWFATMTKERLDVVTLLVQGLTLPGVLRWARLPEDHSEGAELRLAQRSASRA